jgi:hypothetical protein
MEQIFFLFAHATSSGRFISLKKMFNCQKEELTLQSLASNLQHVNHVVVAKSKASVLLITTTPTRYDL